MTGKLRLNSIGRWEIVDDSGERVELTSGDAIEVHIAGHWVWIRTGIEHGPDGYYATVRGIQLCDGLNARTLAD